MSKGKKTRSVLTDINRTLELSKELIEAGASLIDRIQPAKPPPGGPSTGAAALTKLSPYEVMGLPEDASEKQFKARYRDLAKLYHADTGSGSDAMMKRINQAREQIQKERGWK